MNILAVVGMAITVGAIFLFAPVEVLMGNVQRLFYFHVGAAWVGAMVFGVALVCGVLYLWRGQRIYDTVSLASVEVGLVFLSMATIGGSFWGKPAWNTWWLWSPRLTLVTVAWLVYAAYFMLRGAIGGLLSWYPLTVTKFLLLLLLLLLFSQFQLFRLHNHLMFSLMLLWSSTVLAKNH